MKLADLEKSLRLAEFKKKFLSLFAGALVLCASMAWNDAFFTYFNVNHPEYKKYGPWAYAIGMTIVATVVSFYILKE